MQQCSLLTTPGLSTAWPATLNGTRAPKQENAKCGEVDSTRTLLFFNTTRAHCSRSTDDQLAVEIFVRSKADMQ